MVNLSVTRASSQCFLTVKNAKQWFPTATPPPMTSLSIVPVPTTTEAALSAGTTAAIAIGCVFGVIALILIIIIIVLCYWDHKKKKSIPRTIEGLPANPETITVEEDIVGGKGKVKQRKNNQMYQLHQNQMKKKSRKLLYLLKRSQN